MTGIRPRALVRRGALCILLATGGAAADAGPEAAREGYKRAVAALEAGRVSEFRRAKQALEGYALHPYLVYYDARSRVNHLGAEEAVALRGQLADMPLGERLYTAWLLAQARRGRWQTYRDHYVPQRRADARCYHARALYRTGEREAALALTPALWRVGESQPKACDPLFAVWMAQGEPSEGLAWERLGLAIGNNERRLARYLLRFFTGAAATAARAYYDGHVNPRIARQPRRFPDTERGHEALAHVLTRYAGRDPRRAAALWPDYRARLGLSDGMRAYIDERVTLALAREGDFPATSAAPAEHSADFIDGMAQASVIHRQWQRAVPWIEAMSEANRQTQRWRYWLGHSLVETGAAAKGEAVLRGLAGERDYYGFLAAARLGLAPALNDSGALAPAAAHARVRAKAAVERMIELYAVGDLTNARREWNRVYDALAPGERAALVELAAELGWIDQAIFGASRAELKDHLAVRFPTPFHDLFERYAAETSLPVSFLFAIARQESALNPKARSPVGARGLMQLMPATARATAKAARLPRPALTALYDPATNVRLGSHHMAQLMARYGNHRVLAAAAYNAGSGRVKRWLAERPNLPTDVWIETIPFTETRGYVKGVLAFSVVYAGRLGEPAAPVLAEHELRVP